DRFCAKSGAERITDDAAQAGVRAAVRLDRRRMIVRLDLEADVVLLIEAYDAGVVLEDADAPVVLAESSADLLGRAADGLLEQVLDATAIDVDSPLKRLVRAMLGPGLCNSLEFDITWVAAKFTEMGLDRLHLGDAEGELAVTA